MAARPGVSWGAAYHPTAAGVIVTARDHQIAAAMRVARHCRFEPGKRDDTRRPGRADRQRSDPALFRSPVTC